MGFLGGEVVQAKRSELTYRHDLNLEVGPKVVLNTGYSLKASALNSFGWHLGGTEAWI